MTARLASGDCSTYCRCGGSATLPGSMMGERHAGLSAH
jgi:hypothetical protein